MELKLCCRGVQRGCTCKDTGKFPVVPRGIWQGWGRAQLLLQQVHQVRVLLCARHMVLLL